MARGLTEYSQAACLVVAETSVGGRGFLLTPEAAQAWRRMKQAALGDDVTIYIVSAYRSVQQQAEIIRGKLDAGMAIADILGVLAPPGYSEHHTGRAVDLTTPDSPSVQVGFECTAAFAWLSAHASDYGFVLSYPRDNSAGYLYEPWHWRFQDTGD